MRTLRWLMPILIAAITPWDTSAGERLSPTLFQSEILPNWRSIRRLVEERAMRVVMTEIDASENSNRVDIFAAISNQGALRLYEFFRGNTDIRRSIIGFNRRYAFYLTCPQTIAGGPNTGADDSTGEIIAPFFLSDFSTPATSSQANQTEVLRTKVEYLPLIALCGVTYQLDRAYDEHRLTIDRLEKQSSTQVDIEARISSPSHPNFVSHLDLWANPTCKWRIERSVAKHPTFRETGQTTYFPEMGGVFPKEIEIQSFLLEGDLVDSTHVELTKPVLSRRAKAEFSMSFYGLEEPVLPNDIGPWLQAHRTIVSIVLSVLFLVGVFAWKKHREGRTASAAGS